MSNWKEIIQNYICKYSDDIQATTAPLRDHFGIDYFTYHRIDTQGGYTVLVDRPDWAEHYVADKIYLNDPYLRHPSVYKSGFSLIENHGTREYKKTVLKAGKEVLNVDLGVLLIEKHDDSVEFFGFAGDKATSSLQSLYLNHPHILKSFSLHFKSRLEKPLFKMSQDPGFLQELKGDDFFTNIPIVQELDKVMLEAYFKDLNIHKNALSLSPRERQCLKLLLEHKTAKECADALNLKTRTIEFYLENIKNKLSCYSKSELLNIAKTLQHNGLL